MPWPGRWRPTELAGNKQNPAGESPAGRVSGKLLAYFLRVARNLREELKLLEEVRDFLAGALRVVDGHFGALFCSLRGVNSGDFGSVTGHFKGVLGAIGGLHGNCLATFADLGYRAFHGLVAVLSDFVDFHSGLFRSLHRVARNDFGTFFYAMEGILCAGFY